MMYVKIHAFSVIWEVLGWLMKRHVWNTAVVMTMGHHIASTLVKCSNPFLVIFIFSFICKFYFYSLELIAHSISRNWYDNLKFNVLKGNLPVII